MDKHEFQQHGGSGHLAVVEVSSAGIHGTSCDWGDGEIRPCSPDVIDWMPEMLFLAERVQLADLAGEEGCEIIGELSMALAILAGEDLKPCMAPCPGHLREKASEAMKAALAAWRALQEGNRRAAERIRELEGILADHGRVMFLHGPEGPERDEQAVRAMRAHGRREKQLARLAKVDEFLANEKPPVGLEAHLCEEKAGFAMANYYWSMVAIATWRWVREQLREEGAEDRLGTEGEGVETKSVEDVLESVLGKAE